MHRRRVLAYTAASVAASAAWIAFPALAQAPRAVFPRMTEGPFYPPSSWRASWLDQDADLTRVRRGAQELRAQGEHLGLQVQMIDSRGHVIDGAAVEIWQCDALGAYRHPNARGTREDPGFQGFGMARSDSAGRLRFRTIKPVPYPGRTPHIHVKIEHANFGSLVTQLFVAGDPDNERDFLWRQLDVGGRQALAMQLERAPADSGLAWQVAHQFVVPA